MSEQGNLEPRVELGQRDTPKLSHFWQLPSPRDQKEKNLVVVAYTSIIDIYDVCIVLYSIGLCPGPWVPWGTSQRHKLCMNHPRVQSPATQRYGRPPGTTINPAGDRSSNKSRDKGSRGESMHMLAGYDPSPPQHLTQAARPAHTPPHRRAAISSPRLI